MKSLKVYATTGERMIVEIPNNGQQLVLLIYAEICVFHQLIGHAVQVR